MEIFTIYKFIRDDGEQLTIDGLEILLDSENDFISEPDPNTTSVSYNDADGGEMIRQQNPVSEQTINGLIRPVTTQFWQLVAQLKSFWRINHTYKIVYRQKGGKFFALRNCWIASNLTFGLQPDETYSRWTLALSVGDTNWYDYAEDSDGSEMYANNVVIPLVTSNLGGEVWDGVGLASDDVGEVWEAGSGGVQSIMVDSSQFVYPIWTVSGPCTQPTLQNSTTDTQATFLGTLSEGQTLVVNFEEGVAKIGSALATRLVSGLVKCAPGMNLLSFNSNGGSTDETLLSWNNIIG